MKTLLSKFTPLVLGIMLSIVLVTIVTTMQHVHAVTNQTLAVPFFQDPAQGTSWSDAIAVGNEHVPFIVSDASALRGAPKPQYLTAFQQAGQQRIRILGNVQTNYQSRDYRQVYADIEAWYRAYPTISGIYLDQIRDTSSEGQCYVAGLYNHIKNTHPNDLVILNSANHIASTYEPYGDIFTTAFTDATSYSSWRTQYKGFEDNIDYQNRFWHIIYNANKSQYEALIERTRANNAGWVYVTDQTPFGVTPSYWQAEQQSIATLPSGSLPNRGKTTLPRGCISLSASADTTIDTTTLTKSRVATTVTVNNTSRQYDSEGITTIHIEALPAGVTISKLAANDWTCNVNEASCTYAAVLPAGNSRQVSLELSASCEYVGKEITVRLTNFAGNRWDIKVPIDTAIGCDAATPAGKILRAQAGTVRQATTQSVETTPNIIDPTTKSPSKESSSVDLFQSDTKGLKPIKIVAFAVIIITLIGLAIWGVIVLGRRA